MFELGTATYLLYQDRMACHSLGFAADPCPFLSPRSDICKGNRSCMLGLDGRHNASEALDLSRVSETMRLCFIGDVSLVLHRRDGPRLPCWKIACWCPSWFMREGPSIMCSSFDFPEILASSFQQLACP